MPELGSLDGFEHMKPKDIFGLIVRVCGLYLLRPGLMYFYDFWYWCQTRDINAQPDGGVRPYNGTIYIIFGIVYLVVAIYFLRGAPKLVEFSYPEAPSRPKDTDEPAV